MAQQVIMNEVQSSNIRAIGFDNTMGKPGTGKLYVQFKSSPKVYKYIDVPFAVHIALMNAESIGSYFATNIKPTYRVEGPAVPDQGQDSPPPPPPDTASNNQRADNAEDFKDALPLDTSQQEIHPRLVLDSGMPDEAVEIRCGKASFKAVERFLDNVRIIV